MQVYDDGSSDNRTAMLLELAQKEASGQIPEFANSPFPDRFRRVAELCRTTAELKQMRADFYRNVNRIFVVLSLLGFVASVVGSVLKAWYGDYDCAIQNVCTACVWIVVFCQSRMR